MRKPPRSPRMPCHPLDIAEISCSKALQTWKNAEHLAEVERQGSEVRANVFLGACGHIKGIRKAMSSQSIANSLLDSTKSPICFLFHPEIAISCQQSHEERRVSLPTGPSPWLYFRKAFAIPHGKCWLNVIADFRPTYLENFRKIKSAGSNQTTSILLFCTLYRLLVCHSWLPFKSAVKSLNATVS